jgi:hypothetical protein
MLTIMYKWLYLQRNTMPSDFDEHKKGDLEMDLELE